MDEMLEKIDALRRRTGASYREAKEALDVCGGDVVAALIELEETRVSRRDAIARGLARGLRQLARLINKGNQSKVVISKNGEVLMEIPVTLCVAGSVMSPWLCALSSLAIMAGSLTVDVSAPKTAEEAAFPGGTGG
ncbi:MAG TPA: DUF4342 domain-containing protein [Firmicutes bacterium]|nr:DUF4342 domain-containing protein [Candidatus Fermentithermobacillaceae bacterium]